MFDHLDQSVRQWAEAAVTFGAFALAAILIHLFSVRIARRWLDQSGSSVGLLLKPIRSLIVIGLVLAGLNYGFQALDYAEEHPRTAQWVAKGLGIAWVLLAIVFLARLSAAYFAYREAVASDRSDLDIRDVQDQNLVLRKLTTGAIVFIGGLVLMDTAGVSLSPFLAGGAIGGIIIGLALQDSLSNVFAGLFMNIDRPFRVGDLLLLEGDREGWVEQVGWRYTKVRLQNDTLFVIPNNKFSQSTFVNLNAARDAMTVSIDSSVAYDSDLDQVEEIVLAVAKQVQSEVADGAELEDPVLRWRQFGDSAITFRLFFRVPNPDAQYRARSMIVKRLHQEFQKQSVGMPVPVRAVQMHAQGQPPLVD